MELQLYEAWFPWKPSRVGSTTPPSHGFFKALLAECGGTAQAVSIKEAVTVVMVVEMVGVMRMVVGRWVDQNGVRLLNMHIILFCFEFHNYSCY